MTTFKRQTAWKINWIKNASEEGGAQNVAISEATPEQRVMLSYTKKYGRMWGVCEQDDLERLVKSNKGLYEVLMNEQNKRVYFDVDSNETDTLEECKAVIRETFGDVKFSISGSVGQTPKGLRYSYHIILNEFFFNTEEEQAFLKMFCAKHETLGFDKCVYTKNRNMKCVNQTKKDDNRVQAIILDDVVEHHFIIVFNVDGMTQLKDTEKFNEQMATIMPDETKEKKAFLQRIDLSLIPQYDLKVPENFEWEDACPLDVLGLIPNNKEKAVDYNVWVKIGIWAYHANISFNDFWNWTRQYDASQKSFIDCQNLWKSAPKFPQINERIVEIVLKKFYPELKLNNKLRKFKDSFALVPDLHISSYRDLSLSDLKSDKKFILLNTPMGTRKTGTMIDWIKANNFKRILMLSARITLSKNVQKRMATFGIDFTNYKSVGFKDKNAGKLDKIDKLICSTESLHYLTQHKYDAVILDECETIFNTFSKQCGTHGDNLENNWRALKNVLINADKVLMMDAFLSKITVDYINNLNTDIRRMDANFKNYYLVNMNKKENIRELQLYRGENGWLDKMTNMLMDGKKIFCFHPKKKIDDILLYVKSISGLKDENICRYFGDSANKNDLENVDKVWGNEKVRLVITNSCITVGVNFDIAEVFDSVFCCYAKFLGGRDFTQALMRIRCPKDNKMHFCISGMNYCPDYVEPECQPTGKLWKTLRYNLDVENYCKRDILGLYHFFDLAGFKMSEDVEDIEKDASKEIKKIRDEAICIFDFARIPDVQNLMEYEDIKKNIHNNKCGDLDRLRLSKFLFVNKFKDESDKDGMAEIWNDGLNDIIGKYKEVIGNKEHIMAKFYANNNIQIGETIPNYPVINLDWSELNEMFKLHNNAGIKKQNLASKILNSFWDFKVYENTKKQAGNGEWIYRTTKKYVRYMEYIKSNIKNR